MKEAGCNRRNPDERLGRAANRNGKPAAKRFFSHPVKFSTYYLDEKNLHFKQEIHQLPAIPGPVIVFALWRGV